VTEPLLHDSVIVTPAPLPLPPLVPPPDPPADDPALLLVADGPPSPIFPVQPAAHRHDSVSTATAFVQLCLFMEVLRNPFFGHGRWQRKPTLTLQTD
jgi:hypothetical protein